MARQDPRLVGIPRSVNEDIQDRAIRHLLFILRLSTKETNEVLEFLDRDVLPDVLTVLERRLVRISERGFDLGPVTTRRLQEFASAIGQITEPKFRAMRDLLRDDLVALEKQEAVFQVGMIKAAMPVNLELVLPAASTLRAVVTRQPFEGMPLTTWFSRFEASTRENITAAVRIGIVEGDSVEQMIRRLRGTKARNFQDGVFATTRRAAEMIARTATIHVSNMAREATYAANSNVLKGVKIIVTLDAKTCVECQGLDGIVFPINEGRRPPFHGRCRCTTSPVTKSFRELGIDADDIPEGTRASMDGQVPESTTYNQWLRRQPVDIQNEALGPTRGRLFRKGKLDVQQFTDRRGRAFTLAELRLRESDAFAAAGVKFPKSTAASALGAKPLSPIPNPGPSSKVLDLVGDTGTHFMSAKTARVVQSSGFNFDASGARTWQGSGLYMYPGNIAQAGNFGSAKLLVKHKAQNPFVGSTAQIETKVAALKSKIEPPIFKVKGKAVIGEDGLPFRAWTKDFTENMALRRSWLDEGFDSIFDTETGTFALFDPGAIVSITTTI